MTPKVIVFVALSRNYYITGYMSTALLCKAKRQLLLTWKKAVTAFWFARKLTVVVLK